MKSTWKKMLAILAAAAVVAVAAEPVETKPVDAKELTRMVKSAKTPDEHLAVARQYELRAKAFEKNAAQHEQRATELRDRQGYNAMQYKWPSMVRSQELRESSLAMQARRAAKESLERAAYHRNMAERSNAPAAGQ